MAKVFGKEMQPLFSGNRKIGNETVLVDKNENITSEEHLASEELNNILKNVTKSQQINGNPYIIDEQCGITYLILKAINKYKHHPSIILINS